MNMTGALARSWPSTAMGIEAVALFRRLLADDSGQDLLEYVLLAALVALASLPGINALQAALHSAYLSWNTSMAQCWQMPAPGAGGGC
jgi:Flp pilus assembly pilin Flp